MPAVACLPFLLSDTQLVWYLRLRTYAVMETESAIDAQLWAPQTLMHGANIPRMHFSCRRAFFDKRLAQEVEGSSLGEVWHNTPEILAICLSWS